MVLSVGRNGECWDIAVWRSFFRHPPRTRQLPSMADTIVAPSIDLRAHRSLVEHPSVDADPRLSLSGPASNSAPDGPASNGMIN